jgi:hypothetical protein
VHGCGAVNEVAVELARKNNALGWICLPCCINKEMYLGFYFYVLLHFLVSSSGVCLFKK